MTNETRQLLKWYAVLFIKVSVCLASLFGHNEFTWMLSESTYCENKSYFRCGGIDASLFLSCGQFRYFWLGVSSGENTTQESDRNYSIYIRSFHYAMMAFFCYNWCYASSPDSSHGEGAGMRLRRSSPSTRNQICTCKSLFPNMMSTGHRGQEVNQECTHACQG